MNLDTAILKKIADPYTGWIILHPGITITVNHSISYNSKYHEFCASCAAWFYAVFQTATHIERNIYTQIKSCRLIDTIENLQKSLRNGSINSSFNDSIRYGQPFVHWYYHNFYDYRLVISNLGIQKTGGLQNMVNCPYPVNYYNPIFQYSNMMLLLEIILLMFVI